MAQLQININGKIDKPYVADNSDKLNSQLYTFDQTSFTKDWNDPAGGEPYIITLISVPSVLQLMFGLNSAIATTSFDVTESNQLSLQLDPKYAIHNSHLYKFTKDIDLIIADYKALGYALAENTNGLLVFVKPENHLDIVTIQGTGLENAELLIDFTTSSTASTADSEPATFSLIPWENVNVKINDLFGGSGSGTDGDSAYQVAVNNGFVGTETDWLNSLVGAQGPAGPQGIQGPIGLTGATGAKGDPGATGPQGPQGIDGADGTSVVIKGTLTSTTELPTDGTQQVGDGYIIGQDLHVWDGTSWVNVGQIKGPQGDKGDKGDTGTGLEYIWNGTQLGVRQQGQTTYVYSDLKGDTGAQGATGPQGLQGIQGIQGVKGDTGLTGATGATGPQGIQGIQGEVGPRGLKGDTGLTGAKGDPFVYTDFTQAQLDGLVGPEGPQGPIGPAGSDAAVDNELKVYQIPIAELSATPTDENIQALVAEWFNIKGYTKLDIQTIGWETTGETVVVTVTYVDADYVDDDYVE